MPNPNTNMVHMEYMYHDNKIDHIVVQINIEYNKDAMDKFWYEFAKYEQNLLKHWSWIPDRKDYSTNLASSPKARALMDQVDLQLENPKSTIPLGKDLDKSIELVKIVYDAEDKIMKFVIQLHKDHS